MSSPPDSAALADRLRSALARARERVTAFRALDESAGLEAVARAWDRIEEPLDGLEGWATVYQHAHPDAPVRERARELDREVAAFRAELAVDVGACARLRRVEALAARAGADPGAKRVVERALRDYRRSGVDRDGPTRERVRALFDELVRVGQEFERNIAEDERAVVVDDPRELRGLPRDFLDRHPPDAEGRVALSTGAADRLPVLTYAESDELRRRYHHALHNRAVPANLEVLPRLLAKRHELATLLGHAHWADYVTEVEMAGSAAEARALVERVVQLARPVAERERAVCLELAAELGVDADRLEDWRRLHLAERARERASGFDSMEARAWFPFEGVKRGVLATAERLYGVRFERADEPARWHPSVEAWDLLEDGRVTARFYLDLHPREGKFKHAAEIGIRTGVAGVRTPVACLLCNFPEPSASDPALLVPDQVRTFFHEFGHLLHALFAVQPWRSLAGIRTERDFVEVPSQLFEEWIADHRVLRGFARHHETGEEIPAELVERMRAARRFGVGLHVLQQAYYASLSLELYERDPAGIDTDEVTRAVRARILPDPAQEDTHFQAAFGHLHGYSATYYAYLWSLVIAKDLFGAFGDDLLAPEVARRFRELVLEPGGSRDAAELVRDFLGRDFSLDAFAAWLSGGGSGAASAAGARPGTMRA